MKNIEKAKFSNGDLLKDAVTGLEGIVMVVAYYSTGCIHYGLQDQIIKKDGTLNDWAWLDGSRLSLVKKNAVVFDIAPDEIGGPSPKGPQV